jgi:hypothetical protein
VFSLKLIALQWREKIAKNLFGMYVYSNCYEVLLNFCVHCALQEIVQEFSLNTGKLKEEIFVRFYLFWVSAEANLSYFFDKFLG